MGSPLRSGQFAKIRILPVLNGPKIQTDSAEIFQERRRRSIIIYDRTVDDDDLEDERDLRQMACD